MYRKTVKTWVLILASTTMLGACGTTSGLSSAPQSDDTIYVAQSVDEGHLTTLGNAYKKRPSDVKHALPYAIALREADYMNRAAIVLAPFADDPDAPADVKSEYAAIQLELGNYIQAENAARRAIKEDPESFEPYHYLAITLDAQGQYETAEGYYRTAMKTWKGDPTAVMNNLALNLATQERLSEAITVLEDAQALQPERDEIERNLRIIRALKETKG